MIYFRDEGENIRNGLNLYPLTSTSSIGFIFRIRSKTWRVRYSKITKKWFIGKSAI